MSGPWEKYAAAETVPPAGPWEKYAGDAPALTLHVDPTAPMAPVSDQVPVDGAAPSMGLVDALARGIVRGDAGEGIKRGATSTLASGLHVVTDALNQAMTPTNMLYGENPLGLDTVADQSLAIENEINKDRQAAAERIGGQPGLADLMRNPSAGLEQGVAHLTNMGAESLPMMAAVLARNPELASALMGGTTGAQEYTDLRGQGVPRMKAAGAAGLTGAIETIGEGLALPTIMGKAGPGTLTRAILENAAQEAPVQIAQQAVEDQATGKQTPLAQQLRDALDAGLVGGALGAGGHVASNVPGLVQGMTGAPRVPAQVNAAAFSPIDATGNTPPPQAAAPSPAAAPTAAPTEAPAPTSLDAMLDALLSGQASTPPPAQITAPAAAPAPPPAPAPTVQQAPSQPPAPPTAPEPEAPATPAAEAPTENQTEGAILDLPMSSLTLSQDVPQFKSGAKENGVVEPLGGTFDERGVGPIQVWRRRDGRMEVISGRHRLDLARRSNKPTIKAQVYNEADGFDAKQAASLDAELNIRDGQGKVSDYVQYFKNAGIDQAEADARGLLARATGKRAFALATEGSEELLAAHSAGQLTDEAAVQIAKAAPGNERLQVLGMKSVQSGKSIAHAANLMRAVSAIAGDKPASQSDMFGLDDSAMHEAEQMAGVASREQRNITERLAAITGASKRPELARKEGIDVHNPEALQTRIRDLRLEKDGWDNWQTDPAKVAQIRDELGMGDIARVAEPEAQAEPDALPQDDRTASMFAEEPAPRGGDMFGAATPQDHIRAATEARDAARNGKTGGRVDTGDGGLFDGPRPQQTDIEGEASRARANEPKLTDFADEPRQRSIARGNEDADRLGLRQAVRDALGPVADRVEYLHGYEGLPEKMRKGVESRNALGRKGVTAAMYSPETGRVFIFTQVTKTPDRAVWHAAHEIAGHEGLRALLGDRIDPALNLARQNPTVKALADEIYSQRKIADQMKKSGRPPGDGFLLATEEALAELAAAVRTGNYDHIAERYHVEVKPSMRESVTKAIANFLRRLQAMIDDIFGSHVFSDEDVRNLLESAWQAAQNKGATKVEPQSAMDSVEDQTETPAFKRWFGDSKVVDAAGKPLVVYKGMPTQHGGPTKDWKGNVLSAGEWHDTDVIDNPEKNYAGFFTSDKRVASRFADGYGKATSAPVAVVPAYVMMERPFVIDAKGQHAARFQFDGGEGWSSAAFKDAMSDPAYDGVILKGTLDEGDVYVPKRPNQIKSAIGNNGAFDPDSGNILESTDRDLVVTHNLSAEKLMHALRMGGLAVPSLAITRGDHALGSFGDITLVGKPELADPKQGAKAYGADIYSPRYPSITYKLDRFALKKLNAKLAPYQAGGREIYGGEISSIDDLIQDKAFKAYAAASDTDGGRYHDLKRIGADLLRKVGADEVLFQGYTNSGNRRYKPHTMANVVAALKKELRGGESMNYGVGSLRAKFTPQFRSVDAIRKNKDRLISKQDFEKVKAEIDDELFKIVDALRAGSMRGNKFDFADTVLSVLEDAPRMGLARALESYDIHGVSDDVKQEMAGFLNKLKHLPTEYFEVKHLRSVGIGEFAAAVVPHDTSPEVVQALQDAGLDVTRYPSGDEQARREAVQSVANADDLLFSTEYTPEQKEFMRKAGMSDAVDERHLVRRALDGLRASAPTLDADAFRQSTLDSFHGIKRAVDEKGGIAPEDDPHLAAEMINIASTMEAVLRFGAPELHGGVLRVNRSVPGLMDALSPVAKQMPQWLGWMVARRAKVLKAQGRENAMTDADIAAGLSLAAGHEQAFKEAAVGYLKLKNAILDLAEQTGIIDPEARKAWDHAEYIPFYRAMDEGAGTPGTRQGLANQSSGIRTLKGGESPLKDPLGNIIANFTRLLDASMKNRAMLLAVDQLGAPYFRKAPLTVKAETIPLDQVKRHLQAQGVDPATIASMPPDALKGVARMLAVKAPEGEDIVRVMRGGKAEFYHVDDPLLLRSLTAFNEKPTHMAVKVLSWFKNLLTAGATATPDFIVRNALRDTGEATVTAKDRFIPVWDTVRGAIDSFRETELSQDLMMAGASFHGGLFHTGDNEDTAKAIKRALRKHGMTDSAVKRYVSTLINPKRLWDIYRSVSEATEMGSRVSLARNRLAAGATPVEAAHEAKDFLNFQRRGDDKFVQAYTKIVPFLNARLQGADRLYRMGTTKGRRGKVLRRLAMMSLLSTLLYWWNDEEYRDAYDEIPDWDKDANWHIAPGTPYHLRIPKPFELGLVGGTLPERMYGAIKYQVTSGKEGDRPAQDWDALMRGLWNALGLNPIPQGAMPIIEDVANKDFYFGRKIEGMGDQYKAPSDRFSATTSPTMRALSKGMAATVGEDYTLSPKRLDHLWAGYTAGMGRYLLDSTDWAVRALTDAPKPPAMSLRDFPLIGTVARGDSPARSTRYVDEFYDLLEQAQMRSGQVKEAVHNGDTARAKRLESDWGWLLGQRQGSSRAKEGFMHSGLRELNRMRDQLSAIRKENDRVYLDRKMSGEAKRKALDATLEKRNALVRKAVRQLRERQRRSGG